MVKLLITGFKHSGTTMMMQLLNAHPQVARIENEKGFIQYDHSKQWIRSMASINCPDPKKYVCGDKLPWETRPEDFKAERAINFSNKWLKVFGNDARIICMLRHPLDTSLSRYPFQSNDSLKKDEKMYEYFTKSVPIYLSWLNSKDKCAIVVYEELLKNPIIFLQRIFKFLKIQNNRKIINKILEKWPIDESRAYSFIRKGIYDSYDYERLIEQAGENKL